MARARVHASSAGTGLETLPAKLARLFQKAESLDPLGGIAQESPAKSWGDGASCQPLARNQFHAGNDHFFQGKSSVLVAIAVIFYVLVEIIGVGKEEVFFGK